MSDIRCNRRRFLGATAGGAAALATAGSWAPQAVAGLPKAHISIQMWSVRDMFFADPEGTLRALADIGYVDIELAGIPGTAASLRAILDDVGIRAYSGHNGWDPHNFDEASYRGELERAVTSASGRRASRGSAARTRRTSSRSSPRSSTLRGRSRASTGCGSSTTTTTSSSRTGARTAGPSTPCCSRRPTRRS